MKPIALISDIHANIDALEAVRSGDELLHPTSRQLRHRKSR